LTLRAAFATDGDVGVLHWRGKLAGVEGAETRVEFESGQAALGTSKP
jgi:hypothetical protein